MVNKSYIPSRGDIVWLDFSPTRGHEQSNVRPALVLSPKVYNQKTGLMVVCGITSQVKGYPYEVSLKVKNVEGVVLADQIRTVAWKERETSLIQKAPQTILVEVEEKLSALLFK